MYNLYHFVSLIIKESQVSVCRHPSRKIDSPTIFGAIMLSVFLLLSGPASALDPGTLPTGGKITSGKGSIYSSGNQMTVKQDTRKMIANWDTFNIGKSAGVAFKQPDADSVALNRIYDQNPSQILGSLSANGKVFLLNPSGIVFGKDAQINVGGLVASSLNMADSDFLAGKYNFFSDGQSGSILNQGNISVIPGGVVALIAPKVTNEGTITATSGDVLMAAGNQVSLDFNGDGLISYTINKGAINALAENKGLIQTDGGLVVMTAEAADSLTGAVVNNSGVIQAQTLQNKHGRIVLLSDMASGTTIVGGKLDASAPAGGDGGFIETSAKNVNINDDAVITTAAPKGNTGTWLIDPYDFTIASSGGDVTGAALTTALASNSVTIQTLSGSVSCTGMTCGSGNSSGNGDIFVNDNITWSKNTLTLNAYRNIEINNELFGSGTAKLALFYGQGVGASGNTATYTVNAPINLPAGNNFSTKLGSDGTTVSYYVITSLGADGSTTGTDLQGMKGNRSRNYALGGNIDATGTSEWDTGKGFAPVGYASTPFTGQFDGLGHSITNLTINRPSQDCVGLFGAISGASILKNVGLLGGSVSGSGYVGGLVGEISSGTIRNVYSTGSVSGRVTVGGLVGGNYGTIQNAYSTGSVSGGSVYIGGLVGMNYSGTIQNAYSTSSVSGGGSDIGGLVGMNYSGTIQNAYSTGSVSGSGSSDAVGGLVGLSIYGTIQNAYSTGSVSGGYTDVGGLVGLNDGTIQNAYSTGSVSGGFGNIGGLVGCNHSGTIQNAYSTGSVSGGYSNIGGLVGLNDGTILSSLWNTATSGTTKGIGGGDLTGVTGLTTSQMKTMSSFVGWDISNTGGTSAAWRIYEGNTYPLLRNFLTPLTITADNVTKTYDGMAWSLPLQNVVYSITGADAAGHLFNISTPYGVGSGRNVGSYNPALYSDQYGYDISYVNGTLTVNKYSIIVTAQTNTKTYDGTTTAAVPLITLGSLQGTDTANFTETYDNKNAGTGKTLTASGTVNDGNSGNNYSYTFINDTTGVINQLALTGTAIGAGSSIYGSALNPGVVTFGNIVGSDDVTSTASVDTSTLSSSGNPIAGSYTQTAGAIGGTDSGNYSFAGFTSAANYTINQLALTGTAIGAGSSIYGSALNPGAVTFGNIVGSDDVTSTASVDTSTLSSSGNPIAGSYTQTAGAIGGADSGNYSFAGFTSAANYTINQLDTSVSGTRVYDASTNVAGTDLTNVEANTFGDAVSVTGTGALADKNVGTDKAVTIGSLVLTGTDAGNYKLLTTGNTLSVTPAPLTITALTNTKTYDGGISAAATPTVGGLQGSDTVTGLSETYDNKNAGTSKTLSVATYAVNDGNSGNNYDVTTVDDTTGVINKAPLSVTAQAVKNTKIYDGTTSAAAIPINGQITSGQLYGTDTINFIETYDNKNVGRRKTLTASAVINDGNGGNNYDCIMTSIDNHRGTINKARIYITAQPNTKVYDATTSAAAIPTVSGLMGDDTVTNLSETYTNKNVRTGKTLKVASYTVNDGNSGYNYKVSTIRNTIGVITPAPLTITAMTNTKTYDATTAAAAVPIVSGLLGSDTVTNLKETYDNKNAGTGKTLSVVRYTIRDGNWGRNYTVNTVNDITGVIDPAPLTITAVTNTKTYDGTTSATAKPVITAGKRYGSDRANFIETYDNKNVGTGKTLTPSGTMNDGNGGNNYSYTFLTNNTGVINKATLYITAQPNMKVYDGTTGAAALPVVAGLKGTDTVTNLAEIYSNSNIGTCKILSVADYSVNDDNGGNNYIVKQVNNTRGIITAAP